MTKVLLIKKAVKKKSSKPSAMESQKEFAKMEEDYKGYANSYFSRDISALSIRSITMDFFYKGIQYAIKNKLAS